jgi:hypothetical protein
MIAHKEGGKPCRVVAPQLYFFPYFRLMGHDFRWEVKEKEAPSRDSKQAVFTDDILSPSPSSLEESVSQWFNQVFVRQTPFPFFPALPEGSPPPFLTRSALEKPVSLTPDRPEEKQAIIFEDQYVEKNFIGLMSHTLGVYSLGVRPQVLKLELFEKSAMERLGKIVKPELSPEEAFERGMKTPGGKKLLYREVLGRMLSLVYFPFWVIKVEVEGETLLTALDAVSESVIQLRAPVSLYEALEQPLTQEQKIVQFRPLSCPNCGWDLPVRKDDVIFFCQSCEKAWQMIGEGLLEIAYHVIKSSAVSACGVSHPREVKEGGTLKYFPFWMVETGQSQTGILKYILPGFRYRRLKALADLAAALSRKSPDFVMADLRKLEAQGCYYDQEDAVNLAKVIQAGMMLKSSEGVKTLSADPFSVNKISLALIPFHVNGETFVEPFTGTIFSRNLLA